MQLRVECYLGYKADERPQRFFLGDRCLEIKEVLDQWYSPGNSYFRVKADDNYIYVLCNHWGEDLTLWTLESFRQEAS